MKKGDVHWVNFPPPDPQAPTSVQQGRRPSVILQSDMLRVISVGQRQLQVPTLVVVPITSKPRGRHLPASVKLDPTPTNGLDQASWLLLSSLTAVDVQRIAGRLGTLSAAELRALEEGLRLLFAM